MLQPLLSSKLNVNPDLPARSNCGNLQGIGPDGKIWNFHVLTKTIHKACTVSTGAAYELAYSVPHVLQDQNAMVFQGLRSDGLLEGLCYIGHLRVVTRQTGRNACLPMESFFLCLCARIAPFTSGAGGSSGSKPWDEVRQKGKIMKFDNSSFVDTILADLNHRQSAKFPMVFCDESGDCVEIFQSDEPYNAERIDGRVTVFRGIDSKSIVGAQVKGLQTWISRILTEFPGLQIDIVDEDEQYAYNFCSESSRGDLWIRN